MKQNKLEELYDNRDVRCVEEKRVVALIQKRGSSQRQFEDQIRRLGVEANKNPFCTVYVVKWVVDDFVNIMEEYVYDPNLTFDGDVPLSDEHTTIVDNIKKSDLLYLLSAK